MLKKIIYVNPPPLPQDSTGTYLAITHMKTG